MEKDGIKHVYTGSRVEAGYIRELLKEQEINSFSRNTLDDILPTGAPEDAVLVYVSEHDYDKAMEIINKYLGK